MLSRISSCLPWETIAQAGIASNQFRKCGFLERSQYLVGFALGNDVGGDADCAAAITTVNSSVGPAALHLGNLFQGHVDARGCADDKGFNVEFINPMRFGESDHDFDFISASLLPQGLGTIEGTAQLPCDVTRTKPQTSAFREHFEIELLFAGRVAVVDVLNVGKLCEFLRQSGAGPIQNVDVAMGQFHRQGRTRTRTATIGLKAHGFQTFDRARFLPPDLGYAGGSDRSHIGLGQIGGYPNPVFHDSCTNSAHEMAVTVFRSHLLKGINQPISNFDHVGERCPVRKHSGAIRLIGFDLGHHDKSEPTAGYISHREKQNTKCDSYR